MGRVNWMAFVLAVLKVPGCKLCFPSHFSYPLVLTALKVSVVFVKIVKDTIVTGFKTNEACL
jgi:hypothetical protein